MRTFYFECPTLRGQAMVLGEAPDSAGPDEYVEQDCPMCARAFWVNPTTRHVRPDARPARQEDVPAVMENAPS